MADFRSYDKDKREGRSSGSRFGGKREGGRSEGRSFGGRAGRPAHSTSHGSFERDGGRGDRRSGAGRSFGGGRGGFGRGRDSGRDRRDLPECDAVCAKCGKDCKVPFKPTGDKPVYCKECFGGMESSPRSSEGSRDRRGASSSGVTTAQFDQFNKKLDKILEILNDAEITDNEA